MGLAGVAESALEGVGEVEGLPGAAAVEWLSRVPLPRLVINPELRVLWSNAAAREAITNSSALSIRNGMLRFDDGTSEDQWRTALAQVESGVSRWIVTDRDGNADLVLSAFAPLNVEGRAICVAIMLVNRTLDLSRCGFSAHFSLTRSEARIAQALVNLESPKDISQALGVSISTVRTHIRSIYVKLSINSQTEVLRLAMSYCMV